MTCPPPIAADLCPCADGSESAQLWWPGRGTVCLAGLGAACLAGLGAACLAGRGTVCLAGLGAACLAGLGTACLTGPGGTDRWTDRGIT